MDHGVDKETEKYYSKDNWPVVGGSKGFVEKAHLQALSESREVKWLGSVFPFERVVGVVCEHYGCSDAEVLKTKRGRQDRNLKRWTAMKLTQEYTEMTLLQLAERFHVGTYSAISTTVGKLNELMGSDKKVVALYNALRENITELYTQRFTIVGSTDQPHTAGYFAVITASEENLSAASELQSL